MGALGYDGKGRGKGESGGGAMPCQIFRKYLGHCNKSIFKRNYVFIFEATLKNYAMIQHL